jgi:PQQ-like domain
MSDGKRQRQSGHVVRSALVVVAILVLGAALGLGGLKVFHKVRGSAGPSAIVQASAGYGLSTPISATVVGDDLFVANQAGDSVSVVNASSGAHVATVSGPSFDFDRPTAITSIGTDVFVANGSGNSVTEFAAGNRAPIRVISGSQYQFSDPMALAGNEGELFVLSSAGTVTGVSLNTGALLDVAQGADYGFRAPSSIAVSGDDVFVTNSAGNSVTVLDGGTLAFLKTLEGPEYRFATPAGAVAHGGDLWVTNTAGDSVTQISVVTGDVVRVIVDHTNLPTPGPITAGDGYVFTLSPPGVSPMVSQVDPRKGKVAWMMCNHNGPYLFDNPQAVAVAGENLWVVNKDSNSLTEMDTDSGALIRTIS